MVNPTNRTDVAIVPARCSVCAHPDRKQFDDDLLLRRRTQAEVGRQVGVDRSSVSRHFKNHVMPTLAAEVINREYSVMNIADEIDRVYGRTWMMFEEATLAGDYRLARDLLRELRLALGLVLNFASKVADGGIQRFINQTVEGQQKKSDEAWELLESKLIELGEKRRSRAEEAIELQEFDGFQPVDFRRQRNDRRGPLLSDE